MAYSGTLAINQPAAYQVYQRATSIGGVFGKGTALATISLNASVAPALLEYQLRDAGSPSSVLAPWATAGTALPSGSQSLTIGIPAQTAWYLIDIRANGDPASVVSTTSPIGAGEVIAAAGQSLATDLWDTNASGDTTALAALGVTTSPYCSAFAVWNGNTALPEWSLPGDGTSYRSTFVSEFLRLIVATTRVNAALVGYAYNGTAISSWQSGQPNDLALRNVLTAAGSFGTFIWCQGHQDAKSPGASESAYVAALNAVISGLALAFPRPFRRILCSIPSLGTAAVGRFDTGSVETVRAAHLQYVSADPLAGYVAGLDAALAPDGIHPSQAGNITFARHFYRAAMVGIGGSTAGDAGPALYYASRAPGSPLVTLNVRTKSPLSTVGDLTTQFQVFASGQTTNPYQITSVVCSPSGQIAITLAATPGDGQALDVWYRRPLDSASATGSGIYDSTTDQDGLVPGRQLAMIAGPIVASAPAWHRPLLVRPGVPLMIGQGAAGFAT